MKSDSNKILGVILARGGSKRIPLKNIKMLAGEPLISYMIKAALGATLLDHVVVSTDHADIARVAEEHNVGVIYRPAPLCSDECPTEPAVQHAVEFVEYHNKEKVDTVVNLQCTSPFTTSSDIDSCVWYFLTHRLWYNSVVAVKEVTERPEYMFVINKEGAAEPLIDKPMKGEYMAARNLPKMLVLNGAIYVTKRNELMLNGTMVPPNTGMYIMPFERSIDIDTALEFEIADYLMRRKKDEGSNSTC